MNESNLEPAFPRWLVMVLREMLDALTTRITSYAVQQSAFGVAFQAVNGCVAQHSGQLLAFGGKTCSLGRSFTTRASEDRHMGASFARGDSEEL